LHRIDQRADRRQPALQQRQVGPGQQSPEPGAEEYAVHDFDGWAGYRPGEYESLEHLARIAAGLAEHGAAFGAWANHCRDHDYDLDRFEEAYRGDWPSVVAYTEELLDDLGATETLEKVPEWLQPYVQINVEALARDLQLGGDLWAAPAENGEVHVFDGTL
jgi:antirestriction protein